MTLARRGGALFWRGSGDFLAIGVGFMLVEIPLIQKSILHLGHPSYATTTVLSTLLLGSGAGAVAAARVPLERIVRLRLLCPLTVGAASAALWVLVDATLGASMAARVVVGVAALTPLGFVLGFAFPTAIIRFGQRDRSWFWALNGAASVLASVATVALAPYLGFAGVVAVGGLCYLAACLALPSPKPVG